jgi:hypothetical protein
MSCSEKNSNGHKTEDVEVSDTDTSVQYYLPMNVQAWAQGNKQTTNDLKPSGRLLLTAGRNVKAAEFSSGYKKVYNFRCEPVGNGWYKVTCWLRNPVYHNEETLECYVREEL